MGDPIRNNPVRTPPLSTPPLEASTRQSSSSMETGTQQPAEAGAPPPEELADQAAADLDALTAAHRRPPRRRRRSATEPRPDLTPRHVAERLVRPETNATRYAKVPMNPFFEAMEPAERTEFMEQVAQQLADVALGHIQGAVHVFNRIRGRINERRSARGEQELPPPLALNGDSMRTMLQNGIELGLEAGVHKLLETALQAIFGEPSQLPNAEEPASSLEPLPPLSADGVNLRFSGSF